MRIIRPSSLIASAALAMSVPISPISAQDDDQKQGDDHFQLTSTTFTNNTTLPIIMIHNIPIPPNGVNGCSIDGSAGGNQSPELTWTGAPARTRTFVVVAYDVTAAFTHWGMYNIPGRLTGLPENAGVRGSPYGAQIVNDFGSAGGAEYDGPCPPPNFPPNVHQYVFTVYALDTDLQLPGSANFPPNSETLFQALIEAGRHEHILATARLVGRYSTTSP